jgi:DNA primase
MASADVQLEAGNRPVRISSRDRVYFPARGETKLDLVSTPISWAEIHDVEPRQCAIVTVPARFAKLGDLHRGIDDDAFPLDVLLAWADRDGLD